MHSGQREEETATTPTTGKGQTSYQGKQPGGANAQNRPSTGNIQSRPGEERIPGHRILVRVAITLKRVLAAVQTPGPTLVRAEQTQAVATINSATRASIVAMANRPAENRMSAAQRLRRVPHREMNRRAGRLPAMLKRIDHQREMRQQPARLLSRQVGRNPAAGPSEAQAMPAQTAPPAIAGTPAWEPRSRPAPRNAKVVETNKQHRRRGRRP